MAAPSPDRGKSHFKGMYLVKNPLLRAALSVRDAYWKTTRRGYRAEIPSNPARILLSIGGQLGDAVIATSAIHQLHRLFPNAEIGVLCPSAVASVFDGHPAVTRVHRLDHWFWSPRGARTAALLRRWRDGRGHHSALVGEIARAGYEIAIDLYPFFPNTSPLVTSAGIPVRVGYMSGGGGPLLTHPVAWVDTPVSVSEQHSALIARCWPEIRTVQPQYSMPSNTPAAEQRGRELLAAKGIRGRFAVFHTGTSVAVKRWPSSKWVELTGRVQASPASSDITLVLTGQGEADSEFIESVRGSVANTVSLCDETDWQTFRWVIEHAAFLVTADSVAGHLASAAGVPVVVVTAGMADPVNWKPLGNKVEQLMVPVPCAPCFLPEGCATMRCVRDVAVGDVTAALARLTGPGQ